MKTRILILLFAVTALLSSACGGPADADLKAAAETALKGDAATTGVTVQVKDGVATISGEVKDDASKAKAADLAKVEGVNSVINDVNVAAPPPPVAYADDATIKTKVEEALKEKSCGEIEVEVRDGTATLRGSIAQAKLGECIMAAQETKPKNVVNLLKLEK